MNYADPTEEDMERMHRHWEWVKSMLKRIIGKKS